MTQRTVEDLLRAEYFDLLPEARSVVEELATEVRHWLLPFNLQLSPYERLQITSRIKECQSAIDALRRRQEGGTFDRGSPEKYSLASLNDLAGVRVLVFPRDRIEKIDSCLQSKYSDWTSDPVPGLENSDKHLALKYHGYCSSSSKVRGELQILPLLTGLFWEVEHSSLYKPTPELKGMERSLQMREQTRKVLKSLEEFEETFQAIVKQRIEDRRKAT